MRRHPHPFALFPFSHSLAHAACGGALAVSSCTPAGLNVTAQDAPRPATPERGVTPETGFGRIKMQRLYSGFRSANVIRKDRPLTNDELATFVPSVFLRRNMPPVVSVIPTFQRSACWINSGKKGSNRFTPVRLKFVMKAREGIHAICCACAVMASVNMMKFRKLFC